MSRILILFLFVTSITVLPSAEPPLPVNQDETPQIEVVFVLDTTGSMGGLIAGAKDKIWSIALVMATATPTPRIRIGLVGYRDRGDTYVTTVTDLTEDLDAVYTALMAFAAEGGGDTPESVNQALHEAITDISWSEQARTYRSIFLVGDAPPHMDYQDDVHYKVSAQAAVEKGIIINTIQCGNMGITTPFWMEIAKLGRGTFAQVGQSGGAVAIATEHDATLIELSAKLEATRCYWGDASAQGEGLRRQEQADALYAAAAPAALASRAAFNSSAGGKLNLYGANELIDDLIHERTTLAEISEERLPQNLRDLPAEQRPAAVAALITERQSLEQELQRVQALRDEVLAQRKTQQPSDAFDLKISADIAAQAAVAAELTFTEPCSETP